MNTLKNNNSPIGFFDSGVGGLTVLRRFKELLPSENIIFFGDTAHVPYGEKSKEQLIGYSRKILDFFSRKSCKAVVMACNTTSSLIYDDIKNLYEFELYPVVQSVAKVLSQLNIIRLGVFATRATITSGAYQKEINKYNPNIEVYGQFCPDWVKIVEENVINEPNNIELIKHDLDIMLKNNPQKIILGCTHYPYLLNVLTKFAPKEMFIDPSVYFVDFIKYDLECKGLINKSTASACDEFYVSAKPEHFKKAAELFYKLDKDPILINL